MMTNDLSTAHLAALVKKSSKHGDYQALHPWLHGAGGQDYRPAGKQEKARQAHMERHTKPKGQTVLDIGANTGYFTFGALQAGAAHVTAIEGNKDHAAFIDEAGKLLKIDKRMDVRAGYFDFFAPAAETYDLILCLNVLHHLGDDFGDQALTMEKAKTEIRRAIRGLARHGRQMWLQLGFNWKGNRHLPLFADGTKREIMAFVADACKGAWSIQHTSVFSPHTHAYEECQGELMARFDNLGEFLNRPLFLLERKLPTTSAA